MTKNIFDLYRQWLIRGGADEKLPRSVVEMNVLLDKEYIEYNVPVFQLKQSLEGGM